MTNTTSAPVTAPRGPAATGREKFAAATLWFPVVAVSVTAALWIDRLPAVLPRQWNGSEVTSTVQTEVLIGVTGTVALIGALAGLLVLSSAAADIRRGLVLAAGFVAGVSAGVWFVIAGLVLVTGSSEPDAGAWPLLAVAAGAYGLIPFAMSPARRREHRQALSPPVVLGDRETGAWFTTLRVPVFERLFAIAAVLAVAVAVFAAVAGAPGATSAAITLALVTVICLVFARIRVSVDRRGLRVVSSVFRLPLKHLPLDQIESASAETMRPYDWGGWGYRVLPGRSAIVLASGPGVIVQRRNGTVFGVTVPEPDMPAALLTALAAR